MKVDLSKMYLMFEELLPATNEEQEVYWFKSLRKDGIFIILSFSIYQSYVDIIVHTDQKTVAASLSLENKIMKVNLTQMLLIFDSLLPQSNEEQAVYWFESKREDGLTVNLFLSIYEECAGVTVYAKNDIIAASLRFEICSEIRVLDEKRKCLEILHKKDNSRCFLSLLGNSILEYSDDKNV